MLQFQENTVAGQSTGISWIDSSGLHIRKAIGKVNSYLAKYPDFPTTNTSLGHSRWATVGSITPENQHPISIMYKGKRIGYGAHNGKFTNYSGYEYLNTLVNKTDSAVLFSIYSQALERLGDSWESRRQAFRYVQGFIRHEGNHNLIIMFEDGQVLFGGNALTITKTPDAIGLMTFGFKTKIKDGFVYQIKGFEVQRFSPVFPKIVIKRKTPKKKKQIISSCYMNNYQVQQGLMGWDI